MKNAKNVTEQVDSIERELAQPIAFWIKESIFPGVCFLLFSVFAFCSTESLGKSLTDGISGAMYWMMIQPIARILES